MPICTIGYSSIYEDIPEASRLWKKTALEEENHQKQFELAMRLMNEIEFEIPKNSLKRVHSIQHDLLTHLEHIKNNKPDLLHAVSKSVQMEEKLADLHVHSSLHFSDEAMQKFFRALSNADRDHVAVMNDYLTSLHPELRESKG